MQSEKIIERIRKLFALGASSNQHEAELAMAKANELMQEHQISVVQLDDTDDEKIVREEYTLDHGARYVNSIALLAQAAAQLYNAKSLRYTNQGAKVTLIFYGTPSDIVLAKATFNHLLLSWHSIAEHDIRNRLYDANVPLKTYKNSHLRGYAYALLKRIEKLVDERNSNVVQATGKDLVLVKDAALNDFMTGIKTRTAQAASVNAQAYHAGKVKGENIALGGSVGNDAQLRLAKAS